ncbi:hypothetical protein RQP46_005088 [Phenoliferia psychrophenolica]
MRSCGITLLLATSALAGFNFRPIKRGNGLGAIGVVNSAAPSAVPSGASSSGAGAYNNASTAYSSAGDVVFGSSMINGTVQATVAKDNATYYLRHQLDAMSTYVLTTNASEAESFEIPSSSCGANATRFGIATTSDSNSAAYFSPAEEASQKDFKAGFTTRCYHSAAGGQPTGSIAGNFDCESDVWSMSCNSTSINATWTNSDASLSPLVFMVANGTLRINSALVIPSSAREVILRFVADPPTGLQGLGVGPDATAPPRAICNRLGFRRGEHLCWFLDSGRIWFGGGSLGSCGPEWWTSQCWSAFAPNCSGASLHELFVRLYCLWVCGRAPQFGGSLASWCTFPPGYELFIHCVRLGCRAPQPGSSFAASIVGFLWLSGSSPESRGPRCPECTRAPFNEFGIELDCCRTGCAKPRCAVPPERTIAPVYDLLVFRRSFDRHSSILRRPVLRPFVILGCSCVGGWSSEHRRPGASECPIPAVHELFFDRLSGSSSESRRSVAPKRTWRPFHELCVQRLCLFRRGPGSAESCRAVAPECAFPADNELVIHVLSFDELCVLRIWLVCVGIPRSGPSEPCCAVASQCSCPPYYELIVYCHGIGTCAPQSCGSFAPGRARPPFHELVVYCLGIGTCASYLVYGLWLRRRTPESRCSLAAWCPIAPVNERLVNFLRISGGTAESCGSIASWRAGSAFNELLVYFLRVTRRSSESRGPGPSERTCAPVHDLFVRLWFPGLWILRRGAPESRGAFASRCPFASVHELIIYRIWIGCGTPEPGCSLPSRCTGASLHELVIYVLWFGSSAAKSRRSFAGSPLAPERTGAPVNELVVDRRPIRTGSPQRRGSIVAQRSRTPLNELIIRIFRIGPSAPKPRGTFSTGSPERTWPPIHELVIHFVGISGSSPKPRSAVVAECAWPPLDELLFHCPQLGASSPERRGAFAAQRSWSPINELELHGIWIGCGSPEPGCPFASECTGPPLDELCICVIWFGSSTAKSRRSFVGSSFAPECTGPSLNELLICVIWFGSSTAKSRRSFVGSSFAPECTGPSLNELLICVIWFGSSTPKSRRSFVGSSFAPERTGAPIDEFIPHGIWLSILRLLRRWTSQRRGSVASECPSSSFYELSFLGFHSISLHPERHRLRERPRRILPPERALCTVDELLLIRFIGRSAPQSAGCSVASERTLGPLDEFGIRFLAFRRGAPERCCSFAPERPCSSFDEFVIHLVCVSGGSPKCRSPVLAECACAPLDELVIEVFRVGAGAPEPRSTVGSGPSDIIRVLGSGASSPEPRRSFPAGGTERVRLPLHHFRPWNDLGLEGRR